MVRRFLVFIALGLIIFGLIGVVIAQENQDNPRKSVSGHGGSSGSGSLQGSGTQQSSLRKDCTNAVARFLIEEWNITMCGERSQEIISRLTNPGQTNEDTPYKKLYSNCGGTGDPVRSPTIIGNIQLSISNICGEVKRDCMCKIRLNELEGKQSLFPAPQEDDIVLYPGQWTKITVKAIFEANDYEEDTYTVYCGSSPNTVTPSTITISPGERKILPNEKYRFKEIINYNGFKTGKYVRVRSGSWDRELPPQLRTISNIQISGSPDELAMKECLEVPDSVSPPKADSDGVKTALTPEFSLFGVLVTLLVCVLVILGVRKRS